MYKNELDKHFTFKYITYAISAFDGTIFFSGKPVFRKFNAMNFFSREFANIENRKSFWKPELSHEIPHFIQHLIKKWFPSLYDRFKRNFEKNTQPH